MDFQLAPEDQKLQQEVADFVAKEWDPQGFDVPVVYGIDWHHEDVEYEAHVAAFEEKLVAKGWYTMHWPQEFGGKGIGITTQLAYREAMAYARSPVDFGGGLVAPVLMIQGQDWQKEMFLPRLANAEKVFAQGFSEPDAGSDLASLKTRAVRDGDDYIVSGQKIWGTYDNPWIHMLVRTDPEAPKHRGITYLLAPLKDDKDGYLPGISVHPIHDALGRHRWDELFMEDVRVPARNIIGEENRGWYAAMTTLSFERSNIQGPASLIRLIEDYIAFCKNLKRRHASSPIDEPVFRHQLANQRVELEAMRMLSYRVAWMQSQGIIPQRESSMTKFWGANLAQKVYRLLSRGLRDYSNLLPGNAISLPANGFLNSRAYTTVTMSIEGGTDEIQKNIIAQRGLGLPR